MFSFDDDDPIWWILLGCLAIAGGWFLPLLEAVRVWLLAQHILVTEGIVIPFAAGTGLDWPRVLVVAAAAVLIVLVLIRIALHRARKERARRIVEGVEA